MTEIRISSREAGQRIDKYLKKYFPLAPGSFIYKMLRKKNITLNGKKAAGSELIGEGDLIRLFLSDETISSFRGEMNAAPAKTVSTKAVPDKTVSTKTVSTKAIPTKTVSTKAVSTKAIPAKVDSIIAGSDKTVSAKAGAGSKRDAFANTKSGTEAGYGYIAGVKSVFETRRDGIIKTKLSSESGLDGFAYDGLEILYEDDDIALFVKPAGMLSQPGNGREISAADLIPDILLASGSLREDDLRAFHPAPLNRLDRNTSGILLCGLSMRGAQTISRLIRSGEMKKEYLTIVQGTGLRDGTYSAYAVKDPKHNRMRLSEQPSKNAVDMVTEFHVLGSSGGCSLVKATLITGRTHQIRAQLAWLGFPVAGDRKYGTGSAVPERLPKLNRQMLHAFRVSFPENTDPCSGISGRIFTADVPDDFRRIAIALNLKEALDRALTS